EFEALLLGQELLGLASVITLGAAGDRPTPSVLAAMLGASPWLVAGDADPAGDQSAEGWLARSGRCQRGRPPGLRPHLDDEVRTPKTDWTDLYRHGVNLRRWWSDWLGGVESPPLFTPAELSGLRWGPAVGDSEPGLVVDRPDRARMMAALTEVA